MWTISKDDIKFVEPSIQGDKVYTHYQLTMHNTINIYTNVRLGDACEKMNQMSSDYEIAELYYCGYLGCGDNYEEAFDHWTADITWNYWDFGNIRDFNNKQNMYSGDLKMSFDIVDTSAPNLFEDKDGNTVSKDFEFMVVRSAGVKTYSYGKLSEDKPDIVGVLPETYDEESDYRFDYGEDPKGDFHGVDFWWDPQTDLVFKDEFNEPLVDSWDIGIQGQSVGSSLNPKLRDGSNIPYGDAKTSGESQEDGSIYYNVGSITPVVQEYYGELSWIHHQIMLKDVLVDWLWEIHMDDVETSVTKTEPVALHVQNRYIQSDIFVTFDVWTANDIDLLEGNTIPLDPPAEYYTDLIWLSIVSGHGGGHVRYVPGTQWFDLFGDLIFWIIIIIFIAIGVYVFVQIGIPIIKGARIGLRAKKKLKRG